MPSYQLTHADSSHNMVAVYVESLHTVLAVVYRPPDSPDDLFSDCMDKLQELIDSYSRDDRSPDIYVLEDFNMPLFNWEESVMPTNPPNSAYGRLMKFLEANFLTQMVREPTRGNNTLDLLLTTKPQDVIEIQAQSTKLSDHKLVECKLSFNPTGLIQNVITQVDRHSFRSIDYHRADIAAMNLSLTKVDWNSLQRLCDECGDQDGSMFKELIVLTVLQISITHSPAKAEAGKGSKSRKVK